MGKITRNNNFKLGELRFMAKYKLWKLVNILNIFVLDPQISSLS